MHREWVNLKGPVLSLQDNTYHLLLTGRSWKKNLFFNAMQHSVGQEGLEGQGWAGQGRIRKAEWKFIVLSVVFLIGFADNTQTSRALRGSLKECVILSLTLLATTNQPFQQGSAHSTGTLCPISPFLFLDLVYSVGLINSISSVKQLLWAQYCPMIYDTTNLAELSFFSPV